MLTLLIGCVILGILAGFLAGLLGLGGGVILVPALVFLFYLAGFDPNISPTLAIATSITIVMLTTISSALAHHQHGHIQKATLLPLIPMLILGAVLGSYLSNVLPGWLLLKIFGGFMLFMSLHLWHSSVKAQNKAPSSNQPLLLKLIGVVTGSLSGLLGIGGGSVLVPALLRQGMSIKHAIGTTAACSFITASVATITHIYVGWGAQNLPAFSTGSVYWPAVGAVIITSIPCAKIGAKTAKQVPAARLQRILAGVLMLVALRFLL